MERNKGCALNYYPDKYVVLDFETTGVFRTRRVVSIGAIKVINGEITDRFETLINPEMHIPREATEKHHITDEMVVDAPVIQDVIDSVLDFIKGYPLVGYNIAAFDYNILYDNVYKLKGIIVDNDYIDVLHMAQRSSLATADYKLTSICECFGVDISNAHNAVADCVMTKSVFEHFKESYGDVVLFSNNKTKSNRNQQYSKETLLLKELEGFVKGILVDDEVSEREMLGLMKWMEANTQLAGNYLFDNISEALDDILDDRVIELQELSNFKNILQASLNPVQYSQHEQLNEINGKHFCVTGDFNLGSRPQVIAFFKKKGMIQDATVKMDTDYVIVGDNGSDKWKFGNYGGKIKKAMENQKKGSCVQIVSENEFLKELNSLKKC